MSEQSALELRVEPADAPDAVALVRQLDEYLLTLYPVQHTHLVPSAALAQAGTRFVVARQHGIAVGCGAVRRMGDYAEIKRMYVTPVARGQSIGQRILERLETEALALGLRIVRLETGVLNVGAVRLYERAGYRRIPVFGEYTDNGVSLCFEKVLV